MTPLFICDIDGTVALKGSRKPFDWGRVGEDQPNEAVCRVMWALLHAGYDLAFVSGRPEECRTQTQMWLYENISRHMPFDLYMRPDGDYRKDSIVKREIYDEHFADRVVLGVFDDRPAVVEMWRGLGLTVFQLPDGTIDKETH